MTPFSFCRRHPINKLRFCLFQQFETDHSLSDAEFDVYCITLAGHHEEATFGGGHPVHVDYKTSANTHIFNLAEDFNRGSPGFFS